MTVSDPEQSPESSESPMYYIDFQRLAQLNRSAVAILAARRGPAAPSRLKPDHELDDPQELVDEIADFATTEEDFIRTDMPLQEIIFRILLTRRNQPTPLRDLHYELTEKWATPMRPINVTLQGLRRILDSDSYYGFSRDSSAG
jgi:hypothetical protein